MSDFYYSKPGPITPIGLVGHKLAIWATPNWMGYRILYLEGYPRSAELVFDMGAVLAGQSSTPTALATLELTAEPPEMVQLRLYPLDDIQAEIRRAQSDVRFKSKNIVARADLFTPQIDACLHTTEFVVLKDDEPLVVAFNPTGYNLAQSRLAFFGFRYVLEDMKIKRATQQEMERAMGPVTFVAAGGL